MTGGNAGFDALISATRLRLRIHAPFFAALALFAEIRFTDAVAIAATDGRTLYFNPDAFQALTPAERDGLFLHELLHAALMHPIRRGTRELERFNIAADIVVNGMIVADGNTQLPAGAVHRPDWEHLSVEEIYDLLHQRGETITLPLPDLLARRPAEMSGDGDVDASAGRGTQTAGRGDELMGLHECQALEAHWKQAIQQAHVMARRQTRGDLPIGISRHLLAVAEPELDWRSQLWRYLVHTPNNYCGFDRRFFYQGLYLDWLEGESVEVFCCIDTSGSVGTVELALFMGELLGILSAYPMLRCQLWYADADCYGPYPLDADSDIPIPEGGGGTNFCPFFRAAADTWSRHQEAVCIYLTDGYGSFPETEPELPVLWVVIPGGLDSSEFPFGEVVRLRGHPP
jgi:predicted metal-dependent peptidase